MTNDRPSYLIDSGAAEIALGVKPARIRQWVARGKLAIRGRNGRRNLFDSADIERLLEASSTTCHTRRN